jgi:hypothetical protein
LKGTISPIMSEIAELIFKMQGKKTQGILGVNPIKSG